MRRWLLLILFTKLVDAGYLLSLASFLAQTSLGAQNKSAQHFLSIELAFSGENNFYSGKRSKMSKNDEYVSHMRKLFFFSADPTTNLGR